MSQWKLVRLNHDKSEYALPNGECSIGRKLHSTIHLNSTIVSRDHCVIHVDQDTVEILDPMSSNGTFINNIRIPRNVMILIKESAVIGVGWGEGTPFIEEQDKFIFKLIKAPENICEQKIIYESDDHDDDESKNNELKSKSPDLPTNARGLLANGPQMREIHHETVVAVAPKRPHDDIEIINISDDEDMYEPSKAKISKLTNYEHELVGITGEVLDDEIANIKHEFDDEPIKISDDESCDADLWLSRLSQSQCDEVAAPNIKVETVEAQIEEEYSQDIIKLPIKPIESNDFNKVFGTTDAVDGNVGDTLPIQELQTVQKIDTRKSVMIDPVVKHKVESKRKRKNDKKVTHTNKRKSPNEERKKRLYEIATKNKTEKPEQNNATVCITEDVSKPKTNAKVTATNRGAFLIEAAAVQPPAKHTKAKCHTVTSAMLKIKSPNSDIHYTENENHKTTSAAPHTITSTAEVHNIENKSHKSASTAPKTQSSSTDIQTKENKSHKSTSAAPKTQSFSPEIHNKENKSHNSTSAAPKTQSLSTEIHSKENKSYKCISEAPKTSSANAEIHITENVNNKTHLRVSSTKPKPLNDSQEIKTDKPMSKVKPTVVTTAVKKKSVRFSDTGPEVRVFQIEPGNKLINIKYAKPNLEYNIKLANYEKEYVKPLDRQYVMTILKWNTNWLSEKNAVNKKHLPDLTGENVAPIHLFHTFQHLFEYIKQIGHLLLIDIWESLAHDKSNVYKQENVQEMRIESVSPRNKPNDSYVTICVNMSKSNMKNVPRQRDILMLALRPGVSKFFYVHDITNNSANNLMSIHLHTTQSDKLHNLQRGDIVHATNLINVGSYMTYFQAMQCLATSPLCEIILRPQLRHFTKLNMGIDLRSSKWTMSLNDRQLKAVESTVAAALSEEPSIQMIQGPPGTGKSSVICSIVMTYFYGMNGRRHRDRGKILICASSNAAVDELVIRLLNVRQTLPHGERFRMVRVGRDEAMHERARLVSLKSLAERNVMQPRHYADKLRPDNHLTAEMMHLEAKENMWRSALDNTSDPARQAYCKSRLEPIVLKRRHLQTTMETGSFQRSPAIWEQEVVQKADIIATTLTSVANHRIQWLKDMVTLCIVDEAGQAIEPVTLIPLTLGVKRLALIGDPQQLPGFTNSQYAKELGLGQSLFSRLSACGPEGGAAGPAILLNKQYRMHAHIADYPNRAFYGGQIENMAPGRSDLPIPPYSLVFITGSDHRHGIVQTMNEREAWGVARLVTSLHIMAQAKRLTLAVITPYVAQKETIKKCLRTTMGFKGNEPPVEVNTVDSFQGQERDVVVVSLARRHGVGFLHDAGRMNVMLTRARHSLLICVDPNALQDNEQWRTLIQDAKNRNLYKYLPEHFCRPCTAENASNDDVLKYLNK